VRVDTHVHTSFSGNASIHPLKYLLRESYNSPEGVYRRAKARGIGVVGLTEVHHGEIQRGEVNADHIARIMPWINGIEVRNVAG